MAKVVRDGEDRFHKEYLGPVALVPLIGAAGWNEPAMDATPAFGRLWSRQPAVSRRARSVTELIREAAEPLPDPDDHPAFGAAFEHFAKAQIVLLGEATHGTSEFYRARAQITPPLIQQHGFNIVAVEADWPDAAQINRYVRHKAAHVGSGPAFRRFPQWMWRNVEIANFVDWLCAHNAALHPADHAGFFGLDIYNMNASIAAVIEYLDRFDPEAAAVARERYGCLTLWQRDPATYGRAALTTGYAKCERPVLLVLRDLLDKELEYEAHDRDSLLDAADDFAAQDILPHNVLE